MTVERHVTALPPGFNVSQAIQVAVMLVGLALAWGSLKADIAVIRAEAAVRLEADREYRARLEQRVGSLESWREGSEPRQQPHN